MQCFSLGLLESFLVWLVVAIALIAIVNLFVPWAMAQIGGPPDGGLVLRILQIIIWAVIAIFVIYLVFAVISCLVGGGFPALPLRR